MTIVERIKDLIQDTRESIKIWRHSIHHHDLKRSRVERRTRVIKDSHSDRHDHHLEIVSRNFIKWRNKSRGGESNNINGFLMSTLWLLWMYQIHILSYHPNCIQLGHKGVPSDSNLIFRVCIIISTFIQMTHERVKVHQIRQQSILLFLFRPEIRSFRAFYPSRHIIQSSEERMKMQSPELEDD